MIKTTIPALVLRNFLFIDTTKKYPRTAPLPTHARTHPRVSKKSHYYLTILMPHKFVFQRKIFSLYFFPSSHSWISQQHLKQTGG